MKIATYSLYMAEKQKDNYDFETLEFGDLKVGDLFAVKDEEKDKLLLFVKTEPFTAESSKLPLNCFCFNDLENWEFNYDVTVERVKAIVIQS